MNKKEFDLQKKLIELKREAELMVERIRHSNHMKEIEAEKQAKMEVQRIRAAEIKKSQERGVNREFMENYSKDK